MKVAVAFDVGGSTLRAALVDLQGNIVRAARRPLSERGPEHLLDQMSALVSDLHVRDPSAPMAVGLAGQIWLDTGMVAIAPNLGWRDVPFGHMLDERFGRPVRLANDLDAIAVGEAACGAGRGEAHVLCVFVGTGVGMGVVIGDHVIEGADGFATELGHTKVASVEEGRRCGCGERGCLEAYTSGRHLPDLLAEKVAAGVPSRLLDEVKGDLRLLTSDRIELAAQAGDPAAKELWQEVGEHLGRALGNLVTLFNPRVLVLGGGVLLAAAELKRRVIARLRDYAGRPQLERLVVRDSELGDHAGLVGAGLLAHRTTRR